MLQDAHYPVLEVAGNKIVTRQVPALTALNERLRDDYITEIQGGVDRWNKIIEQADIPFRLVLPHKGFHRAIGNFAGKFISPEGRRTNEGSLGKQSAHVAAQRRRSSVRTVVNGGTCD